MGRPILTVLMLGGARRVSMAELLKRAGERLGYDIQIVSYELDTKVPIATVGKVVRGLAWKDEGVVDDILRVVIEHEVKIILPFVDGSISVAARCKQKMPDLFVPVSDPETSMMMFDKKLAAEAFKNAGIPIPTTYKIIDAEMPVIAKPRFGSASRGIHIFHHMDDLMHLDNISEYLLQEYLVDKKEYTVDCYVSQEGEILVSVPRERLEVMGGEVTRTVTTRIPELEKMSRDIIRSFNLFGPVTLQFLYDMRSSRYLLMEINPRLGGGVICSVYAGAPIPDYILREALGAAVEPCEDWANNCLMARYQKETIFYNS
ncbi:MAG: ATP-grasp domain-containing protein [Muribaculaceae bacterium]|nr:ATP-grasp domain-containing protein [Muribaculaceae bacterium]